MIKLIDLNVKDLHNPDSPLCRRLKLRIQHHILGDDDEIVEKDVVFVKLLDGLVEDEARLWHFADPLFIDELYATQCHWVLSYPNNIAIRSWEHEEMTKRWAHMNLLRGLANTRLKGHQYNSLVEREKLTMTRQSLRSNLSFLSGRCKQNVPYATFIYLDLLLGDSHRATITRCKAFSAMEIRLADGTVVYLPADGDMLVVDGVVMSMEQAVHLGVFCKSGNTIASKWCPHHYLFELMSRHDLNPADDKTRLTLTLG